MRRVAAALALAAAVSLLPAGRPAGQSASSFAQQIAALSEPGGYFDTDNLVSNESSYLQVLPELRRRAVTGGVYIGVGPDQNFTYIAELRPTLAFIVDIRRDNLLLHLLFKALFQLSRSRIEYLSMLFGRPVPADDGRWRSATIERLVEYVERTPVSGVDPLRARVDRTIDGFGVPIAADERRTIDRFHRGFIDAGLALRFQSAGQPPRSYYPTYRDLLLDKDSTGRQANVLASEDAFQFVRSLQLRDLIVPVVGDIAGSSALAAVGHLVAEKHERLSAFYTSNVEFYLFRSGTFPRFVRNLSAIPRSDRSVIIRSIFNRYALGGMRPSDDSASQLHRVDDLLAASASGRLRGYADLVGR
jgi:hypothetical protein